MEDKVISIAILGCGSRGCNSYGQIMINDKRFKIVSLCDIRKIRTDRFSKEFKVDSKLCFNNEDEFFKERRADAIIIATQDADHVRHAIRALELGYDILVEKPVTASKEECYKLLDAQKKYGGKIVVCHVLRYAPVFTTVMSLLKKGTIGNLVDIDAIEQVAYWHDAHSYVRGNWRNSSTTSPMIMAKCCHDMDLLQYYAQSKAVSISSIGSLSFFKKENQPKGASDRCDKCKFEKTCPYSAYNIYVKMWKQHGKPTSCWPQNVVCQDEILTEKGIIEAYKNNNYGQCVFASDNNVVDHQQTNILFENGVTANLCMMAFTGSCGRIYKFHGTMGEIDLDEEKQELVIKIFGKPADVHSFDNLPDVSGGHGGGDAGLVNTFYEIVLGKTVAETSLESSIESHLMAIAAEESRLKNGEAIFLHKGNN